MNESPYFLSIDEFERVRKHFERLASGGFVVHYGRHAGKSQAMRMWHRMLMWLGLTPRDAVRTEEIVMPKPCPKKQFLWQVKVTCAGMLSHSTHNVVAVDSAAASAKALEVVRAAAVGKDPELFQIRSVEQMHEVHVAAERYDRVDVTSFSDAAPRYVDVPVHGGHTERVTPLEAARRIQAQMDTINSGRDVIARQRGELDDLRRVLSSTKEAHAKANEEIARLRATPSLSDATKAKVGALVEAAWKLLEQIPSTWDEFSADTVEHVNPKKARLREALGLVERDVLGTVKRVDFVELFDADRKGYFRGLKDRGEVTFEFVVEGVVPPHAAGPAFLGVDFAKPQVRPDYVARLEEENRGLYQYKLKAREAAGLKPGDGRCLVETIQTLRSTGDALRANRDRIRTSLAGLPGVGFHPVDVAASVATLVKKYVELYTSVGGLQDKLARHERALADCHRGMRDARDERDVALRTLGAVRNAAGLKENDGVCLVERIAELYKVSHEKAGEMLSDLVVKMVGGGGGEFEVTCMNPKTRRDVVVSFSLNTGRVTVK